VAAALAGLSAGAGLCHVVELELRAAATAYSGVDWLDTHLHDRVVGILKINPAVVEAGMTLARTGSLDAAAQAALAADPEAADVLVTVAGSATALGLLAPLLPDGHGVARGTGLDASGVAGRPPRRLTDLLADLAQRNADVRHGEIDVRILTMPDGSRRVIVDITGTKSWTLLPTSDVTSLTTDTRAVNGLPTAYEEGVRAAMQQAGVRPEDEVMLVGHSEGGLVAVNTARGAVESGEFNVTHVVTAGAPLGRIAGSLPSSVQLLALENERDVVPHADGTENPDRVNVTTATADHGDGTLVGDHDIRGAYLAVAADVQASRNRSVRDFLAGVAGYFNARSVRTHTFQITRSG
jgi:hypothetical protein